MSGVPDSYVLPPGFFDPSPVKLLSSSLLETLPGAQGSAKRGDLQGDPAPAAVAAATGGGVVYHAESNGITV